jgi:hypothetical protein
MNGIAAAAAVYLGVIAATTTTSFLLLLQLGRNYLMETKDIFLSKDEGGGRLRNKE